MKHYFIYFLVLVSVSFLACSNDDDGGGCSANGGPIAITVDGVPMTNVTGSASVFTNSITVSINGVSSNNSSVFFTAPNMLGTYNLNFDLTGDSRTVTAFVPAESLNVILSEGCYEVVSISDSEVVVRFNVAEDNTSVKGELALSVL